LENGRYQVRDAEALPGSQRLKARCSSASGLGSGPPLQFAYGPVELHGEHEGEINNLTNASSNRLEAELTSAPKEADREILALLKIMKAIRAAIIVKETERESRSQL
jgi:hypothetical protein